MKPKIFALLSTCMKVSVSLLCLFAPYQMAVVCCNSVFHSDSLHMDHRTVFYVRVGLAQAYPDKFQSALQCGQSFPACLLLSNKQLFFALTMVGVKHKLLPSFV